MTMVAKLVEVVVYRKEIPRINSHDPTVIGLVRSRDKLNTFPLAEDHGHQIRQDADFPWESPTVSATLPLTTWQTWGQTTICKIYTPLSRELWSLNLGGSDYGDKVQYANA